MEVPWCRDSDGDSEVFFFCFLFGGAVCGFSLGLYVSYYAAYDVLLLYYILHCIISYYITLYHIIPCFIRSYLIVLYSDYCILHYNISYYFTFHFIIIIILHYVLSTSLPVKSSIKTAP